MEKAININSFHMLSIRIPQHLCIPLDEKKLWIALSEVDFPSILTI